MIVLAYKLKFETPVHFGAAELGGKLEATNFVYSSDTLFSALCCELSDGKIFSEFLDNACKGKILLSDLFPYTGNNFYLPKPILSEQIERRIQAAPLDEVRQQFTKRKKLKKLEYLRASNLEKYLSALKTGKSFIEDADFGSVNLMQKVSCRENEPLPYYVAGFSFNDDSGLYLIATFDDKKYSDKFTEILKYLGISGIGGKRSSGFGKFQIIDEIILNETCANEDLKAVYKMLTAENSKWQMCISSILPTAEDIPLLKQSYYRLKKRGGFISISTGNYNHKKNSVYIIGAGSCFLKKIEGSTIILDKFDGKEILRFGKGIFLGLNYE